MANEALLRKQKVIAVKETVKGQLEFPATDGSAVEILATDLVTLNQNAPLTDNNEIRNSRDVLSRIIGRREPGSFTIPVLLRPSGTVGVPPQDDVLWESLLGSKEIYTNACSYYQSLEKPSFSLWVQTDHTVFFAKGCVAESLSVTIDPAGGIPLEWSGRYMLSGWCGTSTLTNSSPTGSSTITVADVKRFSEGGRIYNKTKYDDNSGEGYEIISVDINTNTLYLTTGISNSEGWSIDDTIEPYLPSTNTDIHVIGKPAESRKLMIDFGGENELELNKALNNLSLTINDPVAFVDELTEYPESYIEDQRNIEGTLTIYFRQQDLNYLYNSYKSDLFQYNYISIYNSATSGNMFRLIFPKVSINVPQVTANSPAVMLDIGIKALGATGEDSFSVSFN